MFGESNAQSVGFILVWLGILCFVVTIFVDLTRACQINKTLGNLCLDFIILHEIKTTIFDENDGMDVEAVCLCLVLINAVSH